MKLGEITVIYAVTVSIYVANIKSFRLGSSYRPPSLKCELTLANRRRSKITIYKKLDAAFSPEGLFYVNNCKSVFRDKL